MMKKTISRENKAERWYADSFIWSLDLMRGYIENVEFLINKGLEDYDKKIETVFIEESDSRFTRIYDIYQDMDSETWDLDYVFNSYYPTVQRCSALITIYSFFEYNLERLCRIFMNRVDINGDIEEINDKGIKKYINYLNKIVGLDFNKNSKIWRDVVDLLKLRNNIVHNNSQVTDKIKTIANRIEYLDVNIDLILKKGILEYGLNVIDNLMTELDRLIKNKYQK